MKHNIFYIILSLILTLAVTDYIWVDLLHHEQVTISMETGSEEVGENKIPETRQDMLVDFYIPSFHSISFKNNSSGVFKFGSSYRPLISDNHPKFFITYCQLRLHC